MDARFRGHDTNENHRYFKTPNKYSPNTISAKSDNLNTEMNAAPSIPKIARIGILSIFYVIILILIITTSTSIERTAPPELLKSLFQGTDKGFIPLGNKLKSLKPLLPKTGVFSFITDDDTSLQSKTLYREAQSSLCPLVLNWEPKEQLGILFCRNASTAEKRLKETGYEWLSKMNDSQGIVRKLK
ncbi:MAG: hypothetical protein A3B72_04430 [Omnitrophica bacterium RIFCSPHIGHO2_02_FULL_45_28]|nr:MAG: hypothetical protein A3B72_04430 [Omnitrophica bacterium RIFCSPHIGHO2_02_FULL_45_28]